MRICSFNVQNLRLRHREGYPRFDGARDNVPEDSEPQATALDLADRRLTAAVLAHADADVICLQEVFDLESLDFFHHHLLRNAGGKTYPYRFCFPGNDGAGRDVALMSRLPVGEITSHARLTAADLDLEDLSGRKPGNPIFCRDCLMAKIGPLTIYICHFKAPWPDAHLAWATRRLEARAVRRLIEQRFAGGLENALWLVVGDLNEPEDKQSSQQAIAPLTADFSINLVGRLPEPDRWSYFNTFSASYFCLDYMLASPYMAKTWADVQPTFLREGLPLEAERYQGVRISGVGQRRPKASDHAALVAEFTGL